MEPQFELNVNDEVRALLSIMPKIANAVLWVWTVPVFYPYIHFGVFKPEDMLSIYRLQEKGDNTLLIGQEQGLALYKLSRILEGVALTPFGLETLKNEEGELVIKMDPSTINAVTPLVIPALLADVMPWLEQLPEFEVTRVFADQAVKEVRTYVEQNPQMEL